MIQTIGRRFHVDAVQLLLEVERDERTCPDAVHVDPPRHRGSMLQDLEQAGKLSVLYLWLSRKFPKVYIHAEAVREERGRLDGLIEAELVRTSTARVQERARKAPKASRR